MDERDEDREAPKTEQHDESGDPADRSRLHHNQFPVPWMAEKIELIALKDLLPPNRQTRRHTKKQLRLLMKSFVKLGFLIPLNSP